MKISEMNKILKEMKDIVKFDDKETEIYVRSRCVDPYQPDESVKIKTTINGIYVELLKDLDKKKENK